MADRTLSLEEYIARQLGPDAVSCLPFREAPARYRTLRNRQPYTGPVLELSPVQVRRATVGEGFKAELRVEAKVRGDSLISGDGGYWISVVGWGSDEDEARASLGVALVNLLEDAEAIVAGAQR